MNGLYLTSRISRAEALVFSSLESCFYFKANKKKQRRGEIDISLQIDNEFLAKVFHDYKFIRYCLEIYNNLFGFREK